MKMIRKTAAILLLAAIAILPAAGLGEGGFEMLKLMMEVPLSDGIELAEGYSIENDVTADTSDGVLCMIMFGDNNMITISGINSKNKYEIEMFSNLTMVQMLYYSYIVSSMYSVVDSARTGSGPYMILVTYGEGDDSGTIFISNESEATKFAETIMDAVKTLAGQ